ncbi:hypothetical protein JD844_004055 [Phrynosoma platyrhinos]|uniref:Pentraxin (PTX) domain-containing protein n=1 Tax=Phrynosoma platyrhinos TaxID=52577 RepID=A0ABQ7TML4_PHRPL|nr:hypothetical protein JD844_004055 [Phrynosoma platyrhinos]
MFTVCLDFNKTAESVATWAAFSYDVNSSSGDFRNAELALSINKSTLQVFILGNVTEMRQDFTAYNMHRICCVWDGKKKLFEIFHNGSKMKNITLHVTHRCLEPNGTLVLGQLHKNRDGHIVLNPSFAFVGILHYFQMWDYVRDQQDMANCEEKVTSTAPPLPSKAPEPTTTVTFCNIKTNFLVFSRSPNTFDYYDAVELSTNWAKRISHKEVYQLESSFSYSSKSVVRITSDQRKAEILNMLPTRGSYVLCLHPDPKMCPEERVKTKYKGTYEWPQTIPADVTQKNCVRNTEHLASRSCLINIETEKSYWRRQNVTSCQLLQDLPNSIVSLQNVTITMDNAEDLADHILILLNSSKWSEEEIKVLVDKLMDIANCEEISPTLARKSLQIINILMTMEAIMHLHKNLSRILQLTQRIGFKMSFNGRNASIVMPKLALAMMRPDPVIFQGIAFGVVSYNPKMDPEDRSFGNIVLNTYVIGSSIENVSVQNLKEPVNIILQHIEQKADIYRDPINEEDNWNLTLVSYVGCGISSIFLGLALVVYLSIDCWIQDDMVFYISVVAYFCLVFLINVSMFIMVLLQIHAMKAKHHFPADHWGQDFLQSLKRVASLTFLLGLTTNLVQRRLCILDT